jgi:hypothetical protein
MQNISEQLDALLKAGKSKVRVKWSDGRTEIIRIFRGSDSGCVCAFNRRSRRYGYILLTSNILEVSPIISRKTPAQKWENAWQKVIKRLKVSGFWDNLVPDIETALEMGFETLQQARKDYWDISYRTDRDAKIKTYLEKYPALGFLNDKGKQCIKTDIVWHYSEMPKVKKMRFCRGHYNDHHLNNIRQAILKKEKCREFGRYGYDISFEYNPETNRAWYSEEYKDCGNGYYYLALDATHAIYWEKD